MSDAARARAAVEVVAASGAPCLLCVGVADGVAAFRPTDAGYRAAVGTPPGKTRMLFYSLCQRCAAELHADPARFEPAIVAAFTPSAAVAGPATVQ